MNISLSEKDLKLFRMAVSKLLVENSNKYFTLTDLDELDRKDLERLLERTSEENMTTVSYLRGDPS